MPGLDGALAAVQMIAGVMFSDWRYALMMAIGLVVAWQVAAQ